MRLVSVFLVVALVLVSASAFAGKPDKKPTEFTRGLLDCAGAPRINCGDVVQGTTVGSVNNVTQYSCSSWNEGGPEVVYELTLPSPDCWVVTGALSGMSGNDQDIFFLAACDESQCLAYGDASFTSSCLLPGTYYIVVDGYGTAQGAFTLTVTCQTCTCPGGPPPNDTCAGAIEVFDGTNLSADLTNANADYSPGSGGCTGYAAAGKDVVYFVTLDPGEEVTVTMLPTGFDGSLYMVTDCADVPGTCVIGSDNCCTGAMEEITYCSTEGGTYYIICDAYGTGNGGPFDLTVAIGPCAEPPPNDVCATAIEVFDGSVVSGTTAAAVNDYAPTCYYSAVGPDVVYFINVPPVTEVHAVMTASFSGRLYGTTDCESFFDVCCDGSSPYTEISCCLMEGGLFYIIVDGGYATDSGSFTLDVELRPCTLPCDFPPHDTCAEAVTFCGDVSLVCIDTNADMNNDYTPSGTLPSCTGYSANGKDVAYKITLLPGGSVYASMNPNPSWDAAIYLITDCADPNGTCVAGQDNGNPEEIFYTSAGGGVYYLICDCYSSTSLGGPFVLEIEITGGGPSATEKTTWSGVKSMYR